MEENYTQKLRDAANQALEDGGLVRNAYDLAQKADMDPANLSKFLKAKDGKYNRISFSNAAAILGVIGGGILFPGPACMVPVPGVTSPGARSDREKALEKENEKLKNKLEALQEVLTGMCTRPSGCENSEPEKNQTASAV